MKRGGKIALLCFFLPCEVFFVICTIPALFIFLPVGIVGILTAYSLVLPVLQIFDFYCLVQSYHILFNHFNTLTAKEYEQMTFKKKSRRERYIVRDDVVEVTVLPSATALPCILMAR